MLEESITTETIHDVTSPYYMFKYSIRSELTRKYYERRIRTFFDFIGFLIGYDIEKRCNFFAQNAKNVPDALMDIEEIKKHLIKMSGSQTTIDKILQNLHM